MGNSADGLKRYLSELTGVSAVTAEAADRLPRLPGAYLVAIHLQAPLELQRPRFAGMTLRPGGYVYAGSARGPGGIAARVGRHLRRDKRCRWHVDHLTSFAECVTAFPLIGEDECGLVRRLLETDRFASVIPGFGSSDCRSCESHLLSWRDLLS